MDLQVQKKDGSLQPFDRNKILQGLVHAGATTLEAEDITKQVEVWVQSTVLNGVVSAVDLRAKVLELLRAVNPMVADTFESYKKTVSLQVQKKDGSLQPFDRSKILLGVVHAGATPEEAEKITGEIEVWSQTAAQNGVVNSSDIREKIVALLEGSNPTVAENFRTYLRPVV